MKQKIVCTQEELVGLCDAVVQHEWVALDTEFMRVRTYFPRLCLLQIGYGDNVVCIDPMTGLNLDPLWNVLLNQSMVKVLHAARQDLEVAFLQCGRVPLPIFDTQMAAAILGLGDQVGYAALVSEITGVELAKSHTRTDWARRPLTPHQIEYALDDVRYLRDIYEVLCQRLQALGRLDWVKEECRSYSNTRLYDQDPTRAHQRLKRGWMLEPKSQQMLKALAMWREQTARELDKPRTWIVDDKSLMAIARIQPHSAEALGKIEGLSKQFVHQHADAVALVLQKVAARTEHPPVWQKESTLSVEQRKTLSEIVTLSQKIAQREGIAHSLLAPRQDLKRMVVGDQDVPQFKGWRNDLLADELRPVLAGILD